MSTGKIALGVAAGILLAIFILIAVDISVTVAPAASSFFNALFADAGFWFLVVCVVCGVIFITTRSSRPK